MKFHLGPKHLVKWEDDVIYVEGSCYDGRGALVSAGYAACQVDENGPVIRAALGPLPKELQQSIASAAKVAVAANSVLIFMVSSLTD